MKDVQEIINSVEKLPPFPQVALRVMEMVQDEDVSFGKIAEVVQYDQAITANVLRVCNSPFFGLRRKISSVKEALVYMGQKYFMEVVVGMASSQYFRQGQEGYDLAQGELWRHSVACAIASRLLSRKLGRPEDQLLFTTALLHDIGKVVLSHFVAEAFDEIRRRVEKGLSFLEAEEAVVGIDHATLGGKIAKRWAFPEEMTRAIVLHHRPELAPEDDAITPLIYLADLLCLQMGIGTGADGLLYRAKEEVLRKFDLRERDLLEVMGELPAEMERAAEMIKLN